MFATSLLNYLNSDTRTDGQVNISYLHGKKAKALFQFNKTSESHCCRFCIAENTEMWGRELITYPVERRLYLQELMTRQCYQKPQTGKKRTHSMTQKLVAFPGAAVQTSSGDQSSFSFRFNGRSSKDQTTLSQE